MTIFDQILIFSFQSYWLQDPKAEDEDKMDYLLKTLGDK